jgi:hypothetical protein
VLGGCLVVAVLRGLVRWAETRGEFSLLRHRFFDNSLRATSSRRLACIATVFSRQLMVPFALAVRRATGQRSFTSLLPEGTALIQIPRASSRATCLTLHWDQTAYRRGDRYSVGGKLTVVTTLIQRGTFAGVSALPSQSRVRTSVHHLRLPWRRFL